MKVGIHKFLLGLFRNIQCWIDENDLPWPRPERLACQAGRPTNRLATCSARGVINRQLVGPSNQKERGILNNWWIRITSEWRVRSYDRGTGPSITFAQYIVYGGVPLCWFLAPSSSTFFFSSHSLGTLYKTMEKEKPWSLIWIRLLCTLIQSSNLQDSSAFFWQLFIYLSTWETNDSRVLSVRGSRHALSI